MSAGLLLMLTNLLGAGYAAASDVESVEALIRQGVELRQQRHDVRALPLFQKAYGMSRTPRTAGQLGLCEMALGYWLDAEAHLDEALKVREHPWVARNLDDLTKALASVRTNISEVLVNGGPPGAEVVVNGQSAGRLPLAGPLRLGKGAADIGLRSPGYLAASRSLDIPGGTQETVNIVLAKASPETPTSVAGTNDATQPTVTNVPPTAEHPVSNPGRTSAWVTSAAGGAALIFGIVETVVWIDKQHQFDNHTGSLQPNPPISGHDCGDKEQNYGGSGCRGLHSDLIRARTLAFIGYGVAAALGITSVVLFATSKSDRPNTETALTCAPDLLNRGVGCALSF